jgi:phosphomevalonate kinase
MIQNKQLSEIEFSEAIKRTPTYKGFEQFKQGLVSKRANIMKLFDKYQQACKFGIEYIQQNPNLYANDVNMIEDVLNEA